MVKASASRVGSPPASFDRVVKASNAGIVVATLPGAWHTGWPGGSILRLDGVASLIRDFWARMHHKVVRHYFQSCQGLRK